ncbi:MAG: hypothetical protein ACRBDL_08410 [Alphaproteobacteria bacterium]
MSDFVQNIGSAYKPYEVRSSDARMEKKPHDKFQEEQRRGARKFQKHTQQEEKTSLSISALILFLENHLNGHDKEIDQKSAELRKESYLAPWMRTAYSNNNTQTAETKKATNAYQHAAEINRLPSSNKRGEQKSGEDKIYMLLQDLKLLQEQGRKTLKIENSPSFLEGIFNAVDLVKQDQTPNL